MSAAEVEEIIAGSYVGFDTITKQIEHKLLKRGFQFNVILVGTCQNNSDRPFPGICVRQIDFSYFSTHRSDWSWKVNSDKYTFRIAFD